MKKITSIISIFCFCACAHNQQTHPMVSYALVSLPAGTKGEGITNLGVYTPADLKTSYSDTVLVNIFFRGLGKTIPPEKVVIINPFVIPERVKPADQFLIRTDRIGLITPQMENMGFVKWMPAYTNSPLTAEKFINCLNHLTTVMNEYFRLDTVPGVFDSYGFQLMQIHPTKVVPQAVKDSMKVWTAAIKQEKEIRLNTKYVCELLRANGYTPVVIAGRSRVLALGEPCMVQAEIKQTEEMSLRSIINDLRVLQFMDFFLDNF